jgi:hypothetical protein
VQLEVSKMRRESTARGNFLLAWQRFFSDRNDELQGKSLIHVVAYNSYADRSALQPPQSWERIILGGYNGIGQTHETGIAVMRALLMTRAYRQPLDSIRKERPHLFTGERPEQRLCCGTALSGQHIVAVYGPPPELATRYAEEILGIYRGLMAV